MIFNLFKKKPAIKEDKPKIVKGFKYEDIEYEVEDTYVFVKLENGTELLLLYSGYVNQFTSISGGGLICPIDYVKANAEEVFDRIYRLFGLSDFSDAETIYYSKPEYAEILPTIKRKIIHSTAIEIEYE